MPNALSIVEEVIDLPRGELGAALDRLCGEDATLRREVEQLLALDEECDEFLEPLSGEDALRSIGGAKIPESIGPYRVVRQVGEGGFGIVYEARQSEPIERRVALKVIKPGMDSAAVLRRFEMERRTLGLLEHTNIARVLDAGLVPEGQPGAGRPFFAMEYVDGRPITAFAEQERLGLRERLGLVMQVCAAAQHAHTKGVIHRDLKPANIPVTLIDGEPVCKVIDYGIAKALGDDGELADAFTALTSPGAMIGTPLYMSPEQANAGEVDTRSDVYAIGVLLYELLCGKTPFDEAMSGTRDPGRIRSALESAEPASPSTRLGRATRSEDTARAGGPSLEASALRGELDWITMKAIAREPDRRYASALALAEDLRRYLADEPVEAGPESRAYRVSKFVRRNRVGVTAAGIAAAGVLAGSVFSVWFGVRAEAAREAEREQRQTAERNAERVESINRFLTKDLFIAAGAANLGPEATIAKVLDQAAPSIDTRFAGDDVMRTEMHSLIGTMYNLTNAYGNAKRHYDIAIGLIEDGVEIDEQEAIDAYLGRTAARSTMGEHAAAESDVREAIRRIEAMHAPDEVADDHPTYIAARTNLAIVLGSQRRYDEAESIFSVVLDQLRASEDPALRRSPTGDLLVKALSHRASMLWIAKRRDEAAEISREIVEVGRADGTRTGRAAALTGAFWLAGYLRSEGRAEEAAELMPGMLSGATEIMGTDSPNYANALMMAANIYSDTGRCNEALSLTDEAVGIIIDSFGTSEYQFERMSNVAATIADRCGDADSYRRHRTRGLLARLHVAGPNERESVTNLAEDAAADLGSMEAWTSAVLGAYERVSPDDPKRGEFLANAAHALETAGLTDDAERLYREAWESIGTAGEPARVVSMLADRMPGFYESRGRAEEAASWRARLELAAEDAGM